ncbi:DNA polymerase IV [Gemmatimonadota bacterium]
MNDAARRILHADADAFFVAVARLIDPEGAGTEPLLIVGGAADRRGVVTSASYETREFGVRSGMPMAQALRLCPDAVCTPVPGRACKEKSREIRQVLERLTPIVEPASIDEFYVDLTGTERLYHNAPLAETAADIRLAVKKETGVSVSIGGGTSRLVAKLAASRAKPHHGCVTGVVIVEPGEEQAFMAGLQIADIPGVGPRFQERLAERGLRSVRDALVLDESELINWFGDRGGRWIYRKIRAVDTAPVGGRGIAKSMSHEHTFASDLFDDRELDIELQRLAMRVAADLRLKERRARTITVKIRDADFTTRQASKTLGMPVASDKPIGETARTLMLALRKKRRTGVRLLGVAASRFEQTRTSDQQLSLLDSRTNNGPDSEREAPLLRAVDNINERFGKQRIVRASTVDPGGPPSTAP